MLRMLTLALLFTLWGFEKVAAAVALPASVVVVTDSTQADGMVLKNAVPSPGHANSVSQKWQRFLLKKLNKRAGAFAIDKKSSKDKLSTIALVLGLLAFVVLFIPGISVATLLLSPAAIITGFIAKHDNPSKKSRTKAWIGIIAAFIPVLLLIFLLIFFSAFNFA